MIALQYMNVILQVLSTLIGAGILILIGRCLWHFGTWIWGVAYEKVRTFPRR